MRDAIEYWSVIAVRAIARRLPEPVISAWGAAIGMAACGLKPVAEIQFLGFIYPAVDQITNHAARLRSRSRGKYTCPLVIRAPYGAGIKAPEHHSESCESIFCHMPGIKVVMPSTPYNAKGLLISSIRDPDPVVFLESTHAYRLIKEDVPEGEYTIPLERARIVQEGKDVTVISWGFMLQRALKAVEGVDAEVIGAAQPRPIGIDGRQSRFLRGEPDPPFHLIDRPLVGEIADEGGKARHGTYDADLDGPLELPAQADEGHRGVGPRGPGEEPRLDGEAQEPVSDPLAEDRRLHELGVGVKHVVVAGQAGEEHDVGLVHRAARLLVLLPDCDLVPVPPSGAHAARRAAAASARAKCSSVKP